MNFLRSTLLSLLALGIPSLAFAAERPPNVIMIVADEPGDGEKRTITNN